MTRLVPRMLLDMQNRGQLASGMTQLQRGSQGHLLLTTYKELGTVAEGFRLNQKEKFEKIMKGSGRPLAAIGHVRYATCGGDDKSYAQPFEREHGRKAKWFAFAFNGQITNYQELRQELLDGGDYHLKRDTDTEILMHSISYELPKRGPGDRLASGSSPASRPLRRRLQRRPAVGAGDLVVARDPLGFRPLCIAEDGPLFAAASESVPLSNLGFRNVRSLEPGTLASSPTDQGVRIERFAPSADRHAHCFFEWIYFANVASTLDDRSVYLSRAALGKELARMEDVAPRRRHDRRPRARHRQGRRRRDGFELGLPSVEG